MTSRRLVTLLSDESATVGILCCIASHEWNVRATKIAGNVLAYCKRRKIVTKVFEIEQSRIERDPPDNDPRLFNSQLGSNGRTNFLLSSQRGGDGRTNFTSLTRTETEEELLLNSKETSNNK